MTGKDQEDHHRTRTTRTDHHRTDHHPAEAAEAAETAETTAATTATLDRVADPPMATARGRGQFASTRDLHRYPWTCSPNFNQRTSTQFWN